MNILTKHREGGGSEQNQLLKGSADYLNRTRRKQWSLVLLLAAMVGVTFAVGLFLFHTAKNPMTIAAAVAVVPFSTALIRLLLLLKYRPTDEEVEQIRELIRSQPQHMIFGPAVYTFSGQVRLILLTAVEADHIRIMTSERDKSCAHELQEWLYKNGFEMTVSEVPDMKSELFAQEQNQQPDQAVRSDAVKQQIGEYLLSLML